MHTFNLSLHPQSLESPVAVAVAFALAVVVTIGGGVLVFGLVLVVVVVDGCCGGCWLLLWC